MVATAAREIKILQGFHVCLITLVSLSDQIFFLIDIQILFFTKHKVPVWKISHFLPDIDVFQDTSKVQWGREGSDTSSDPFRVID